MKSFRLSFLSAMWHISMRKNKIRIPIRGENIYFSPNDSAEIIKQKKYKIVPYNSTTLPINLSVLIGYLLRLQYLLIHQYLVHPELILHLNFLQIQSI